MSYKVPGLGKATGKMEFDNHLDDGDYLLEASGCKFKFKPKDGRKETDSNCPFQYQVSTTILGGPEQDTGDSPAGRPWTLFLYVDPDHEQTDLMVNKLKNALNAFKVPVRADEIKEENFAGQRAVMRIRNSIMEKGKRKGQNVSNVQMFLAVEDSIEYSGAKTASKKKA